MAAFLRTIANCVFDVPNTSKLSAEEREAARMEAIVQYRTLLRNLQSCGLIEPKAVEKWERQVARVSEPGQSFAVVDSNGTDGRLSMLFFLPYRTREDAQEQNGRGSSRKEGHCQSTLRQPNLQRLCWQLLHE